MESLGRTNIIVFTCGSYCRKSVGSVFPGIGEEKGVAYHKGHCTSTKRFPAPGIVLRSQHENGVNVSQVDKGPGEMGLHCFQFAYKVGSWSFGEISVPLWEIQSC